MLGASNTEPRRPEHTMCRLAVMSALILIGVSPALAQKAAPSAEQGSSIALSEVLAVAKPYPNLVTQVKLRLLASGLKTDQVTCSAKRFPTGWVALGAARAAPYVCPFGRRTLTITAEPTYYDKAGYRLKASDPALPGKAAKVVESRLKWSWK
jgi:hypothetical protein